MQPTNFAPTSAPARTEDPRVESYLQGVITPRMGKVYALLAFTAVVFGAMAAIATGYLRRFPEQLAPAAVFAVGLAFMGVAVGRSRFIADRSGIRAALGRRHPWRDFTGVTSEEKQSVTRVRVSSTKVRRSVHRYWVHHLHFRDGSRFSITGPPEERESVTAYGAIAGAAATGTLPQLFHARPDLWERVARGPEPSPPAPPMGGLLPSLVLFGLAALIPAVPLGFLALKSVAPSGGGLGTLTDEASTKQPRSKPKRSAPKRSVAQLLEDPAALAEHLDTQGWKTERRASKHLPSISTSSLTLSSKGGTAELRVLRLADGRGRRTELANGQAVHVEVLGSAALDPDRFASIAKSFAAQAVEGPADFERAAKSASLKLDAPPSTEVSDPLYLSYRARVTTSLGQKLYLRVVRFRVQDGSPNGDRIVRHGVNLLLVRPSGERVDVAGLLRAVLGDEAPG